MYLVRPPYLLKKFYPGLLWKVNTREKEIYLSFDDGPHPEITPWVLDQLSIYNAKAIFFCVGENAERYPGLCERIVQEGHVCGNHTQNHLNGWTSDSRQYLRNITLCAGNVKSRFFRPPYGRMKKSQALLLVKNYTIVMWDVLSGDFDRNTPKEKCLENTLRFSREGSIVVFHDSEKARINLQYTLPRYLETMKERGYAFKVVPEMKSPAKTRTRTS